MDADSVVVSSSCHTTVIYHTEYTVAVLHEILGVHLPLLSSVIIVYHFRVHPTETE